MYRNPYPVADAGDLFSGPFPLPPFVPSLERGSLLHVAKHSESNV